MTAALAPGQLAAVVTFLEMRQRPPNPVPPSSLRLLRLERPEPAEYRRLFRRVGQRWLWFSRLILSDDELGAVIHHPLVELFAVAAGDDCEAGLLELDWRDCGTCRIAFLGLVPPLAGHGHGRWLIASALALAWRSGIERVAVHTCTLDHPAALPAYRRAGFTAVGRSVEIFADPRLAGILPADCAPQIPLLGTLTSP